MNWIERRKRFHRRRKTLRVLTAISAVLAILLLGGAALPGFRTSSGSAVLPRSRETIWRILVDLDGMPRWRSGLTRLDRLPDLDGRTAWKETGPAGDRVVRLTAADAPRRLVMQNAEQQEEERTIELQEIPDGTGTLVRVTERERIAPLSRVLRLVVPSPAPRFLEDLTRWLASPRPQVASAP